MTRVVFEVPPNSSINLIKEFETAGIGNYTLSDLIYVDQYVSSSQLDALAKKGLKPLEIHHYKISPEPQPDQRGALVKIFANRPVTTEFIEDGLNVGLRAALKDDQIKALQSLDFKIQPL